MFYTGLIVLAIILLLVVGIFIGRSNPKKVDVIENAAKEIKKNL